MRRLHTEGSEHHRDEPCDHAFLERPVEDWEKGRHQHIHLHRKAREATALTAIQRAALTAFRLQVVLASPPSP